MCFSSILAHSGVANLDFDNVIQDGTNSERQPIEDIESTVFTFVDGASVRARRKLSYSGSLSRRYKQGITKRKKIPNDSLFIRVFFFS